MIKELLAIIFLVLPLAAFGAGDVNFNTIMEHLKGNMGPVISLVKGFGYLSGITLIISGVQELKRVGQQQGMMGPNMHIITGPLARMGLGAALIYLPSTLDVATFTLWGNDSTILAYPNTSDDLFKQARDGVIEVVKAIGYVSFVRGFLILNRSTYYSGGGPHHGVLGKGVFHIIGGILAIHITATINIIKNSLGI